MLEFLILYVLYRNIYLCKLDIYIARGRRDFKRYLPAGTTDNFQNINVTYSLENLYGNLYQYKDIIAACYVYINHDPNHAIVPSGILYRWL